MKGINKIGEIIQQYCKIKQKKRKKDEITNYKKIQFMDFNDL